MLLATHNRETQAQSGPKSCSLCRYTTTKMPAPQPPLFSTAEILPSHLHIPQPLKVQSFQQIHFPTAIPFGFCRCKDRGEGLMSGFNGEGMYSLCPLRTRIRPKSQENQSIAHSSTNWPKSASVFSTTYTLNFCKSCIPNRLRIPRGRGAMPLTSAPIFGSQTEFSLPGLRFLARHSPLATILLCYTFSARTNE